ncbi:MAG: hypothetical protein D3903_19255 [Candidatus Electrothrix sp. GM3_4]|nr:hypothetical protein [Candidatus Electrothrix sp. GM3_4]
MPLGNEKNGLTIPLTALNMEIRDLQTADLENLGKDNLHFQAGIGTDGKVTADGYFRQEKGNLNLTVEGLDIKLLNQAFAQLFKKNLPRICNKGVFFCKENLAFRILILRAMLGSMISLRKTVWGQPLAGKMGNAVKYRLECIPFS